MAAERDGRAVARLAPTYLPREPHATVPYRLVKQHGAELLRHARESYDGPLPRYAKGSVRFDDSAPLAAIRRAITSGE